MSINSAWIQALEWRYATKQFDPSRKIAESDFEELLRTVQLAPSSFGLQPWKFIVVRNHSLRQMLKACAWNQDQVTDASHLIVLCTLKTLTETHIDHYLATIASERGVTIASLKGYKSRMMGFIDKLTPEAMEAWMNRQVYLAFGFLMAACAVKKIDACPIEGFTPSQADTILDLESLGLKSLALCPVGYRHPDDSYSTVAKVRFSLADIVIEK